jgi:hypothetical protein
MRDHHAQTHDNNLPYLATSRIPDSQDANKKLNGSMWEGVAQEIWN